VAYKSSDWSADRLTLRSLVRDSESIRGRTSRLGSGRDLRLAKKSYDLRWSSSHRDRVIASSDQDSAKLHDRWSSSSDHRRVIASNDHDSAKSPWSLIIADHRRVIIVEWSRLCVVHDRRSSWSLLSIASEDYTVRIVVALNDTESDYWRVVVELMMNRI